MSGRPDIAVATADRWTPAWPFLAFSVWLAGGKPHRVRPSDGDVDFRRFDGLVIGGGDDLGAELYGGAPTLNTRIDPARDVAEMRALDAVWPTDAPILGVCRGSQIMNVHQGGSLHHDIYAVYKTAARMRTVLPRKRVRISEGARLAEIVGAGDIVVNSLHHQSVDQVGPGLRIAARDDHGVVQAVETSAGPFRIGVQWHPEFLIAHRAQRRLFQRLVAHAAEAPIEQRLAA